MVRKEKTVFRLLTQKPWWVSAGMALSIYILLAFVLPLFEFHNPVSRGFANGLIYLAPVFTILFLVPAAISGWRAWLKRKG